MKNIIFLFLFTTLLFSCKDQAPKKGANTSQKKEVKKEVKGDQFQTNQYANVGGLDTLKPIIEGQIFKYTKVLEGTQITPSTSKTYTAPLTRAVEQFATLFPEEKEKGAKYLFDVAKIQTRAGNYNKAIALYERIFQNYSETEYAPLAKLGQAKIYDTENPDFNLANIRYNEFLVKYPNHEKAGEVKRALDVMFMNK